MYLNYILYPGKFQGSVGLIKKKNSIPSNIAYQFQLNKWPHHIFDLIRVKIKINYNCSASVLIKNKSLIEGKFTHYKWFIQDDNGTINEYDQFEPPILDFKQNGTYIFRLFATDSMPGGYGEWYSDSIHILIPSKPVPNFHIDDTKVCRFEKIKFINTSHSTSVLKNTYLWKFGDSSSSSSESPTYIYNNVGKYTVSLFYSNGYCDSTLIKQYYIEVMNSPRSGFFVDKINGCTPFKINITDTNKHYVSSRQYQFGDSTKTYTYPTNQTTINHIYTRPGKYFIRQILRGYSSCISTFDSIWVEVFKGINDKDTSNIINASVEDTSINLIWNSISGAVNYQILINGELKQVSSDTSIQFRYKYTNPNRFEVIAIDRCNQESVIGRYGMPIFLGGEVIGNNQFAHLKYTPYKQWLDSVKLYQLQRFEKTNWVTLFETGYVKDFYDSEFAHFGGNGCLYRIEALSNNGKVSHSNTLFLDYVPQLYVPNTFSPNDDGDNDIFYIKTIGIKSFRYSILNQWGEIVFKGDNVHPEWLGNKCSQGVYAILIEYSTNSDQHNLYRSTITLIR